VVFGGGVFNRECLYDLIRSHLKATLNDYIQQRAVTTEEGLKQFVTQSVWGKQAGLVGALYLAAEAKEK
jgi:predicted NBD/HSP70 family sugar kinase